MRFDRNARLLECPWTAQLPVDRRRVIPAACRVEETSLRFEDIGRRGKPGLCKVCGQHPTLGSATGMEWFGHRSEVLPQAGSLGGAARQRDGGLLLVEAENTGGAGRSTDRADRGRGVEAIVVVARIY